MPPKKKPQKQTRPSEIVLPPPSIMATRSRRKSEPIKEQPKPVAKSPPKKVKQPKAKAKRAPPKKKGVTGKEIAAQEEEAATSEETEGEVEEMETEVKDEIVSETCEISQQFESLNVAESAEDQVMIQDVEEPAVSEEELQEVQEVNPEILELDTCEYTVEYITEEFVPVAEDSEVVIEEEVETEQKVAEAQATPPQEEEVNMELLQQTLEDTSEEPVEPAEVKPEVQETVTSPPELVKEEEVKVPVIKQDPVIKEKAEKQEKPKSKKKPPKKDQPKKAPAAKKGSAKSKTVPKEAPKKETEATSSSASADKSDEVRRSSRIKSISVLKQRSKGRGLVKVKTPKLEPKEVVVETPQLLPVPPPEVEKPVDSPSVSITSDFDNRPVKVKSRWRRSSELEMNVLTPAAVVAETQGDSEKIAVITTAFVEKPKGPLVRDEEVESRLKQFVHLKENLYLTDRMSCKEAKKMTCDCFLTEEEIERGEFGCGEDCLNRLLMIECGNLCPVGDRCTNKKFQKTQFAPVEVFRTEKKGLGLRAAANIPYGEFILEYVGEVLDHEEFDARAEDYSNVKNIHYYFMSLRADAIIDATMKGNISRFINHSCDPNAETQKWTVNGELRIGFFSTRTILAGEEVTFDYRFQRYGKEAQKCYCEAPNCRGWLGEQPEDEEEEEEEEDEEEEEEEEVEVEVPVLVSPVKTEVEEGQEFEGQKIEEIVEKVPEDVAAFAVTSSEIPKPVIVEKKVVKRKKKKVVKKPRKDIFDDIDQLDEEIDMLVATGLKNQAHTLKLSRLVVRAKEPAQRTKLLRILRRGELPCRRLFLDYHGLRLMHGYMTDALHLCRSDKKYESLRLEMLQTLATLPIPNKTMLQDSKVLVTVEKWAASKEDEIPLDSDSNSPKTEDAVQEVKKEQGVVVEKMECDAISTTTTTPTIEQKEDDDCDGIRRSVGMDFRGAPSKSFVNTSGQELADEISDIFAQEDSEDSPATTVFEPKEDVKQAVKTDEPNYGEEIVALAVKLLEEWSNLKEVFKIPKKERIEQMKEHEREANRGYIAGLGLEQDAERKNENRYRILKRYRTLDNGNAPRKSMKMDDSRTLLNFPKIGRDERRKMFALQVEQQEDERRRKQREMWRQHEQHCILLGTDPRLTAPFDPNRGYQCIWNPQIGQWQNYPIPNSGMLFTPPPPPNPMPPQPPMPAMNIPPPTAPPPYAPYMHNPALLPPAPVNPAMLPPAPVNVNPMHPLPALPYQEEVKKVVEDYTQVKFMGPIPPPAKLPPKWKCAKDKYGRPYYYHIKVRKSQWEPPPLPPSPPDEPDDSSDTTSSSDTSSLSSDTSSDELDSDDDFNDTKMLLEVRRQMEKQAKLQLQKASAAAAALPPLVTVKTEEVEESPPSPMDDDDDEEEFKDSSREVNDEEEQSTSSANVSREAAAEEDEGETASASSSSLLDARLRELLKEDKIPGLKKRRSGLVQEIIISPRTEEDRQQFREDVKRYKQNKERLKKERELILQQTKKHSKETTHKSSRHKSSSSSSSISSSLAKAKMREMADNTGEAAKKIKETFRSSMATVVVGVLNSYRKPDCKEGRIGNTDDFKHLARKLTHFVMLKEMKHIERIEELVCTENVKGKAREYIRKYMSKFGERYQKRDDEPDY